MTLKEVLFGLCFVTIPLSYVIVKIWQDWKRYLLLKEKENKFKAAIAQEIYISNHRIGILTLTIQHEWAMQDVDGAIKQLKSIDKSLKTLVKK